jgi:hypothetical protein
MKPIKTSLRFRTICPSQRSKTTILVSSQSPQDASDTGVATFYQETTCLIEYQVPVLESKLKKAGHAKLNRTRFFFGRTGQQTNEAFFVLMYATLPSSNDQYL